MVKALVLMSGGLDSLLATKIILDQGIDIVGINFILPFEKRKKISVDGIDLKEVKIGLDYLNIIRHPKFGYGSGINPCIDCKIFMLKRAKELMKEYKASFIVMGDVVGQRPMTQNLRAINIIERESDTEGLILRPLSAKLLPETIPEKNGWVDRSKLYGISGRSRKFQIELAKKFNIKNYEQPAGGCRLTEKEFAKKMRNRLNMESDIGKMDFDDINLLSIGRHFFGKSWIIVGRNKEENEKLRKLAKKSDTLIEPDFSGPTILIRGKEKEIQKALDLLYRYS